MDTPQPLPPWVTECLRESFQAAVQGMDLGGTLGALSLAVDGPDVLARQAWTDPRWFRCTSSLTDVATISFGFDVATAQWLTCQIIGASNVDIPSALETVREVLQQTAAGLGAGVSRRLGLAVTFSPNTAVEAPSAGQGFDIHLNLGTESHTVAVIPSEALLDLLAEPDEPQEQEAAGFASGAPPPPESGGDISLSATARQNLELLLEIDLDLSVSFGRTLLPMQDVMKLASGSIVELNRSVSDPVEVLVNNGVIARGEVVVVDGNYGIRITEVISRKERIRSIF